MNDFYSFLWQYLQLSEDQILQACVVFGKKCPDDISQNELGGDVIHLKAIHHLAFVRSLFLSLLTVALY